MPTIEERNGNCPGMPLTRKRTVPSPGICRRRSGWTNTRPSIRRCKKSGSNQTFRAKNGCSKPRAGALPQSAPVRPVIPLLSLRLCRDRGGMTPVPPMPRTSRILYPELSPDLQTPSVRKQRLSAPSDFISGVLTGLFRFLALSAHNSSSRLYI